jgi:eukaryotic-like serine/threonine-protein kinase
MAIAAGTRLNHYEIIAPLGAGGMGEVYRARDTRLGREVAVKLLPAEMTRDKAHVRRFEQEARATSSLNHPNILTVYDVGTTSSENGGAPYIVVELLEGEELRAQLQRGAVVPRQAIEYARQVADGLAAARAKGIGTVHSLPDSRSEGERRHLGLTAGGRPSAVSVAANRIQ